MNFYDNKTQSIAKNTILHQPGDVCGVAYRVVKGCLKSYVLDESGKEHIMQFAPEDWWISDMDSFINKKPSKLFIKAIEDSEVILINNFPQFSQLSAEDIDEFSTKLTNNLIATNNRLISLLSYTAEERYLEFTQTYPQLVQRLPLKYIASYLGMTPEHLSYVRKKLTKSPG